ncbi:MAG: hypothetical protein WBQ23_16265 [Bacteroidota bacterium]
MHNFRSSFIPFIIALFLCAAAAMGQPRVLFQGTVVGYDGKPMKKAHVEMWRYGWGNHFAGEVNITVGAEGRFVTKLYPGLYSIRFAGVDHEYSQERYLFIDPEIDCSVEARMQRSRFRSLDEIDTLFVVYRDPASGGERQSVPMQPLDEGKFTATFDYNCQASGSFASAETSLPLEYHISGLVPERTVNGTDQDGYSYDQDGDFSSVKHCNDRSVTVSFDYAALSGIGYSGEITDRPFRITGAPLDHPYAVLKQRLDDYRNIGADGGAPFADSGSVEWQTYIDQGFQPRNSLDAAVVAAWRNRLQDEQNDSISVYLTGIAQARASRDAQQLEDNLFLFLGAIPDYPDPRGVSHLNLTRDSVISIIRLAAESISPASPVWNLEKLYGRFSKVSDSFRDSYAYRVLRENPSPSARYEAYDFLKMLISQDRSEKMNERLNSLVDEGGALFEGTVFKDMVQREGRTLADQAAYKRSQYVAVNDPAFGMARYLGIEVDTNSVGKQFPPFSFAMVTDSMKYFSDRDLAGKPYILVFGNVSMDGLSSLEAIHQAYHDSGLDIIQVWPYHVLSRRRIPPDDNAVNALRRYGFTLPWTHLQASDQEIERYRLALNAGYASSFLVSPEGIILASELQMNGISMEFAVRNFFDGK